MGRVNDLALALIVGGFGLLGGGLTAFLGFLAANHNRKSGVREQAFAKSVDACAEYVGASHLFLSRKVELVHTADRIRSRNPEVTRPADEIDPNMLLQTFFPLIERTLNALTRAEALAPTDLSIELILKMATAQGQADAVFNDALEGRFSEHWQDQLSAIINDHDEASQELTEHLRAVGAETSYRQFAPGRISKPPALTD
jgi:hypothetical protein